MTTANNIRLTQSEIDQLLTLNRRLAKLERYLLDEAKRLEPPLQKRLADPTDPMSDYEIEATLYYRLRENDPAFDEDDDNFLTIRRWISLEEIRKDTLFCDGEDWRESGMSGLNQLAQEPHCWLFHDLYSHSYGSKGDNDDMKELSLQDCLRVGAIWVDIAVQQQAFLDIDSGEWEESG